MCLKKECWLIRPVGTIGQEPMPMHITHLIGTMSLERPYASDISGY